MNLSIEEHFKIYQNEAAKKVSDSVDVYKHFCDRMTDRKKLNKLLESGKFTLEMDLSAIFADLGRPAQKQNIRDHYKTFDFKPILDGYIKTYVSECESYLKSQDKLL